MLDWPLHLRCFKAFGTADMQPRSEGSLAFVFWGKGHSEAAFPGTELSPHLAKQQGPALRREVSPLVTAGAWPPLLPPRGWPSPRPRVLCCIQTSRRLDKAELAQTPVSFHLVLLLILRVGSCDRKFREPGFLRLTPTQCYMSISSQKYNKNF